MVKRLSVVAVLLSAATTLAGFAPIGDPNQQGASWFQRFALDGVGDFDLVAARIVPDHGWSFESPAHRDFNAAGWSTTYELGAPPTQATAQGPTVNDGMQWDIWFTGLKTDRVAFEFFAFSGELNVDAVRESWDGQTWTPTTGELVIPDRSELVSIPAPGTALLGALGLGLVDWVIRRLT